MSDPDNKLLDSNAMYKALLETGSDWADAKAAYQALDESTKPVLADITLDYRPQSKSMAEAETQALSSRMYKDHLALVAQAHKAYLRAQVKYESLKTLVELRRSEESTRRAEMSL